jgi:Holliday junction resolvase
MSADRLPPVPALLRDDYVGKRARSSRPKAHEKDTARSLGGRRTPASGSTQWAKGDVGGVKLGGLEFLVECKRTDGGSLRVEGSWLTKITGEAHTKSGREPALAIQIGGLPADVSDWVAVPRSVFERLQRMAAEAAEESE